MSIYQPYTYLIGWTKYNIWYYGSEYKNSKRGVANPSNLWTTYFTSSNYVRRFREEYGEPDIVEVRRTFSIGKDCLLWEHKVLRRIKAETDDKWLNKTEKYFTHVSGWNHSDEDREMISLRTKEWWKTLDEETQTRLKSNLMRDARWNKGRTEVYSEDTLKKMSETRLKKNYHWYTNGSENKSIPLGEKIPEGFYRGRKINT